MDWRRNHGGNGMNGDTIEWRKNNKNIEEYLGEMWGFVFEKTNLRYIVYTAYTLIYIRRFFYIRRSIVEVKIETKVDMWNID